MNLPIYKIVVLGEGRVGKTSMSLKYVKNQFSDHEQSTTNASYLQKKQTLQGDHTVKLAIWDTAGQQKYNAIAPVYYRDAVGAIVAYEIVSRQSFEKVKKWVKQLQQNTKNIIITIAGNKSDMQNQRLVDKKQAQNFAKEHNASHFIVSAKSGSNIQSMFKDLAQRIFDKNAKKNGTKSSRRNPRLKLEQQKGNSNNQKKKCC